MSLSAPSDVTKKNYVGLYFRMTKVTGRDSRVISQRLLKGEHQNCYQIFKILSELDQNISTFPIPSFTRVYDVMIKQYFFNL